MKEGTILKPEFYLRNDVVAIARDLLGKVLVTVKNGALTSGIITETEAYQGVTDRASHASGGRYTRRTEVMFRTGGTAYVYLCYGIHSLFNVVTNREGIPHAVLIRSIIPYQGTDLMLKRTGKRKVNKDIGNGPGKVSKLLGIHYENSGLPLTENGETELSQNNFVIRIEEGPVVPKMSDIEVSVRIGVDYAGDDALLPFRFRYKKSL